MAHYYRPQSAQFPPSSYPQQSQYHEPRLDQAYPRNNHPQSQPNHFQGAPYHHQQQHQHHQHHQQQQQHSYPVQHAHYHSQSYPQMPPLPIQPQQPSQQQGFTPYPHQQRPQPSHAHIAQPSHHQPHQQYHQQQYPMPPPLPSSYTPAPPPPMISRISIPQQSSPINQSPRRPLPTPAPRQVPPGQARSQVMSAGGSLPSVTPRPRPASMFVPGTAPVSSFHSLAPASNYHPTKNVMSKAIPSPVKPSAPPSSFPITSPASHAAAPAYAPATSPFPPVQGSTLGHAWKHASASDIQGGKRPLPNAPTKTPDLSRLNLNGGAAVSQFGNGHAHERGEVNPGGYTGGSSMRHDGPGPGAAFDRGKGKGKAREVEIDSSTAGIQRRGTVSGIVNGFNGAANGAGQAAIGAARPLPPGGDYGKSLLAGKPPPPSAGQSGRRPLPPSPTAPPDVSRVTHVRGMSMPVSGPPPPRPPHREEDDDGEEEEDDDEEEEESGEGEEESSEEESDVEPSPQYGIRDLPTRLTRTGLPQPPGPAGAARLAFDVDLQSFRAKPIGGGPRALVGVDVGGWSAGEPNLPRAPEMAPVNGERQGQGFWPRQERQERQRARTLDLNLDDEPPVSLRRTPSPSRAPPRQQAFQQPSRPDPQSRQPPRRPLPTHNLTQPSRPAINIESPAPIGGRDKRADIPKLTFPAGEEDSSGSGEEEGWAGGPVISVQDADAPTISVSGPSVEVSGPQISVDGTDAAHQGGKRAPSNRPKPLIYRGGGGMACGGCAGPMVGRVVSAMGVRWHPGCFRCSECNELLEHVSSYEHEGRAYCHLDFHENFAPRCYHCKTAIIDERFITLDDDALGKRTYHEQHFFCAECGDPFLAPQHPSSRTGGDNLTVSGDGEFLDEGVGFTVYKGHPYCESCHVRLRMPKCKGCKKSIRDWERAVEALGGKWCWSCFVCSNCRKPFDDPSFFQRDDKPFCQQCFSIILRNEV